jgi:hypothetical protein
MTLCQPLNARGSDKWRALLLGNRLRKLAIGEPRRRDARKFHRRAHQRKASWNSMPLHMVLLMSKNMIVT